MASPPGAGTALALTRRARRINRELGGLYPGARPELNFSTPLELAVATILAARSTDRKVNEVTPALFAAYPDAAAYAAADRAGLEAMVHATGYFRAKAGTLIRLGQELAERFGGELPGRMEDLLTLPGFGRKTASVVLGNAFGIPALAVDTHVARLSARWAWTGERDPVKIESDLAALFPRRDWTALSNRVTWHGRRVCHARTPACGACRIAPLCPSAGIGEMDPVRAARLVSAPVIGPGSGAGPEGALPEGALPEDALPEGPPPEGPPGPPRPRKARG